MFGDQKSGLCRVETTASDFRGRNSGEKRSKLAIDPQHKLLIAIAVHLGRNQIRIILHDWRISFTEPRHHVALVVETVPATAQPLQQIALIADERHGVESMSRNVQARPAFPIVQCQWTLLRGVHPNLRQVDGEHFEFLSGGERHDLPHLQRDALNQLSVGPATRPNPYLAERLTEIDLSAPRRELRMECVGPPVDELEMSARPPSHDPVARHFDLKIVPKTEETHAAEFVHAAM